MEELTEKSEEMLVKYKMKRLENCRSSDESVVWMKYSEMEAMFDEHLMYTDM